MLQLSIQINGFFIKKTIKNRVISFFSGACEKRKSVNHIASVICLFQKQEGGEIKLSRNFREEVFVKLLTDSLTLYGDGEIYSLLCLRLTILLQQEPEQTLQKNLSEYFTYIIGFCIDYICILCISLLYLITCIQKYRYYIIIYSKRSSLKF